MKSVLIGALSVAMATASVFAADVPANAPSIADRVQHRISFMTEKLGLTPDQQQQATTIFTNAATSLQALRGNAKTAHQNLKQAIQNNDTAAIDQSATAIGNAAAQRIAIQAKARAAFYQILTPDQRAKLPELRHGHRWGHGHGFMKERQQ